MNSALNVTSQESSAYCHYYDQLPYTVTKSL